MADYNNNDRVGGAGRSNNFLYFVVGGLVAVVAIGFFVLQGGSIGPNEVPTKQSAPAASSAPAEPAPAPATTPPASSTSN